jgi:aspartate/methionine/tyrosine aminotransferase
LSTKLFATEPIFLQAKGIQTIMSQIEIHGTPDYAELASMELTPADVVFFSSNINPYGPPQAVVDAVRAAVTAKQIALYPDRFSIRLRRSLAAYHNVSPDAILVGNGTADLLWLLAIVYVTSQHVVVLGPTFSEYENVVSMMAAQCTVVAHPGWTGQELNFAQSDRAVGEVAEEIAAAHPDLGVFAYPPEKVHSKQMYFIVCFSKRSPCRAPTVVTHHQSVAESRLPAL